LGRPGRIGQRNRRKRLKSNTPVPEKMREGDGGKSAREKPAERKPRNVVLFGGKGGSVQKVIRMREDIREAAHEKVLGDRFRRKERTGGAEFITPDQPPFPGSIGGKQASRFSSERGKTNVFHRWKSCGRKIP